MLSKFSRNQNTFFQIEKQIHFPTAIQNTVRKKKKKVILSEKQYRKKGVMSFFTRVIFIRIIRFLRMCAPWESYTRQQQVEYISTLVAPSFCFCAAAAFRHGKFHFSEGWYAPLSPEASAVWELHRWVTQERGAMASATLFITCWGTKHAF